MSKGTVKFFDKTKGWGFITDSATNKDVFVHHSSINNMSGYRYLDEDQTVEFEITDGEKGKQAINVTVVENTSKEDFEKIVDTINRSAQKVLNGEE